MGPTGGGFRKDAPPCTSRPAHCDSSTRGNWRSVWFGPHLSLTFADEGDLPVPAKGPCPLFYGNRPISKRVAAEIQKQLFWSHRRIPQLRQEATGRTTRHPKSQIIVEV